MRQVAVDLEWQKKGVGTMLVAASEKFACQHGYDKIVLHARDLAVPFYLRLGYEVYGEPFTEVGILHSAMRKKIKDPSTGIS
jgi:predicted GNAT family N-acyltransferase